LKKNPNDYASIAQQFFTVYDAHDVDGMLALCADGALGRYAPYGRESVVPIRGGIAVTGGAELFVDGGFAQVWGRTFSERALARKEGSNAS
jgi:hypothetical protein